MKQWVQIVDLDAQKAVQFPFSDPARAAALQSDLNDVFAKHEVNVIVGRYDDGEVCPRKRPDAQGV